MLPLCLECTLLLFYFFNAASVEMNENVQEIKIRFKQEEMVKCLYFCISYTKDEGVLPDTQCNTKFYPEVKMTAAANFSFFFGSTASSVRPC